VTTVDVPSTVVAPARVWRFYVYRAFSRGYFHLVILQIWLLQAQRLSRGMAGVVLACYALALLGGGNLVRGPLGARLGAKALVPTGEATKLVGLALLVAAGGRLELLLAGQLIGGLGYVMAQGPDSLLLSAMVADGGGAEYRKHESRSMSIVFLVLFGAGLLGAIAYRHDRTLPFLLSMGATAVAGITAMTFGVDHAIGGNRPRAAGARRIGPDILPWVFYYVVTRALALAAAIGLLPLFLFFDLQLSLPWFGFVIGAFTLSASLSGRYGAALVRNKGQWVIPVTALVVAVGFVLLASAHDKPLAVVAMALLGAPTGLVRPLTMGQLNRVGGATAQDPGLLSLMEQIYGLVNAALLIGFGFAAEAVQPRTLLWCTAGFAVATAAVAAGSLRRNVGSDGS
jgi:hypothetical protein